MKIITNEHGTIISSGEWSKYVTWALIYLVGKRVFVFIRTYAKLLNGKEKSIEFCNMI